MGKRLVLAAMLALCILLLCACQNPGQEVFPVATQRTGMNVSDRTESEPADEFNTTTDYTGYDFDNGDYDPAAEEDADELESGPAVDREPVVTVVPNLTSEYAGATPVVLDPIDKPTPTPAPSMSITEFKTYDATKLRLSFDGPVGWVQDDLQADTFVLTNPDTSMSYQATLTVTARAVSADYGENDLKKEVKAVISAMKGDFDQMSTTNTASRTLFDKKGIYEDFTGTLKGTDIKVWGRVHATTVNKTLVVVRVLAPNEYSRVYKDTVYSKFRHTVKFIK